MQNQYVTVSLENQPEAVRTFLLHSYGEADTAVEAAVQCLPCLLMSILLHGQPFKMSCDISSDILFIFSIRCLFTFFSSLVKFMLIFSYSPVNLHIDIYKSSVSSRSFDIYYCFHLKQGLTYWRFSFLVLTSSPLQ